MSRNILETVMGAMVLAIAAIFLVFAYSSAQVHTATGYPLFAKFNKVDGIRTGGDVRLSGIKVGTIVATSLDPKTYQAVVQLDIENAIQVPTDTTAQISSAGLLGDNYMELVPGAADTMLKPGATIQFTQSPTSLQSLLGQAVYSFSHGGNGQNGGASGSPAGGAPTPQAPGKP